MEVKPGIGQSVPQGSDVCPIQKNSSVFLDLPVPAQVLLEGPARPQHLKKKTRV